MCPEVERNASRCKHVSMIQMFSGIILRFWHPHLISSDFKQATSSIIRASGKSKAVREVLWRKIPQTSQAVTELLIRKTDLNMLHPGSGSECINFPISILTAEENR